MLDSFNPLQQEAIQTAEPEIKGLEGKFLQHNDNAYHVSLIAEPDQVGLHVQVRRARNTSYLEKLKDADGELNALLEKPKSSKTVRYWSLCNKMAGVEISLQNKMNDLTSVRAAMMTGPLRSKCYEVWNIF